jgi:hypothetical protein
MGSLFVCQGAGAAMLETIGAAVFEWLIGETLDNARLMSGREPYVRDLDRVVREAVAPAVAVVTDDPAVEEPLSATLMERPTTRLDPMPGALPDPAACVRRWLAPFNEPTIGGRSHWQHMGLDGDSVVDAVTAKVLRGMTDDARRGGSFELGPSGRSTTGQRLVVCAGALL